MLEADEDTGEPHGARWPTTDWRARFILAHAGDGDTVFALATGGWNGNADVSIVGALAADVMAEAIVRAAVMARSSGGPAASDGTVRRA